MSEIEIVQKNCFLYFNIIFEKVIMSKLPLALYVCEWFIRKCHDFGL